MTPEQAADLPAERHVTGAYVGTDTTYVGVLLKFHCTDRACWPAPTKDTPAALNQG